MSTKHSAWIEGIALWAPRLPDWTTASAVLAQRMAPPAATARPSPAMLPANERRRASDTVALALEAASRACESAGCDPSTMASVFSCTHGDLVISDYMCRTLAEAPETISPTRFHNSVHNAPSGYWSIGTQSHAGSTALTAWHYSFGAGLLEALVQATCSGKPILYVAYDIEARPPMAAQSPSRGLLAAALVLAPAAGPRSRHRMDWQVQVADADTATRAQPANLPLVEGNAMRACLPLYEALAASGDRALRIALAAHQVLDLRLTPCPAPHA
jgi:hypothetical protein